MGTRLGIARWVLVIRAGGPFLQPVVMLRVGRGILFGLVGWTLVSTFPCALLTMNLCSLLNVLVRLTFSSAVEKCDGTQAMRAKFYGSLVVKLYLLVDTGRYGPYAEQSVPTPILSVSEKDLKGKAADTKVE